MIILTLKSRIITQGRARCKFRALYDACSVAWVQSVGVSDTCGRARVDVDICEFGKKTLRIQKYSDTCGRGLSYYFFREKLALIKKSEARRRSDH